MAREELALQKLASSGVIPTWSTPTGDGYKVSNDGMTHIHVKNGNAGTLTITITTPSTIDGNAVADKTVTVLTTAEKEFVFPTVYNHPDSHADAGKIYLDFSVQSSVLVKATHH
jgi:hypothetical protein